MHVRRMLGLAILAAAACRSPDPTGARPDGGSDEPSPLVGESALPTGPAHIRGLVTLVQQGDSVAPAAGGGSRDGDVSCPPSCGGPSTVMRGVLIEETPGEQKGDKVRAVVPAGARLVVRTADGLRAIGFADLRTGMRVEAWFTGPLAMSYPALGAVGTLLVVGN